MENAIETIMTNKRYEKLYNLIGIVETFEDNDIYYKFIKFVDIIIENNSAGLYICFKDCATVKDIKSFYNDLLVLNKVFDCFFTIKDEFDSFTLNINDIDEFEYKQFVDKYHCGC